MKKDHPTLRQFKVFNRYLVPYWPLQALVLLIVLLLSLLGLLGPALFGVTVDRAFLQRDLYLFRWLLLAGLLLTVLQSGLSTIQSYLTAYIGKLLTFDLRRDYTRHLFRLSFTDVHRRPTGEQLYRLESDINTAASLASESIPEILVNSSRIIFLLAICLYWSWELTLAAIVLSPLFYLHSRYFGRKQKAVTRVVKEESQRALAMIQDAVANVKLIKAFGRGSWAVRRYLRHRLRIIRFGLQKVRIAIAGNLTAGVLNSIVLIGFTYYLGRRVIAGTLSLGEMIALTIYLTQLFVSLKGLGVLYRGVMVKLVSWERVRETLNLPGEREPESAAALPDPQGGIEGRGVSFSYRPGREVLSDLSFSIRPGEFVGLAGPSGSGKTTLFLLLLRLIEPERGEIRFDGRTLKSIRWSSIRNSLGIALQEAFLLNRSIRENLLFGRPEAAESEIREALRAADLEETIGELPEGLETVVGEAGSNFSEGQRQRLNIARAVLGKPRILFLDEAASAVGYDSEARIFSRVRKLLPEATIISATHRLGSLKTADRILVLKDGKLVEEGSHTELIGREGFYRTLFEAELK
ncbi:MAG: ABC transporter ATP-binding protein [Candidatus Erginobacter occultus]|nr:ABC transporter ATP-binding protein [Candidatus Erginobacter occultus]